MADTRYPAWVYGTYGSEFERTRGPLFVEARKAEFRAHQYWAQIDRTHSNQYRLYGSRVNFPKGKAVPEYVATAWAKHLERYGKQLAKFYKMVADAELLWESAHLETYGTLPPLPESSSSCTVSGPCRYHAEHGHPYRTWNVEGPSSD